jgi:hypothetical protein
MRLLFCLFLLLPLPCVAGDEYELAPIFYSQSQPKDAVQALMRKMQVGKVTLNRQDAWSVLKDLLKHFDIPEE